MHVLINYKLKRSSFCAGVIASFVSLPPDNVKTKLMKMKAGPDGKMP